MKNLPFLVRYDSNVVLSDGTTVLSTTATALAVAVAAINAAPTDYGLGAGVVIKSLPAVPTGATGFSYFKDAERGSSFTFFAADYSGGYSLPDTNCDSLLTAANLAAIAGAIGVNGTLAPLVTTGPLTKTVAGGNPTTFGVVAAGAATLLYQWQKSTDAGATWTNITNAGVYTTATTATLNISDVTGLNATQYRCRVTNDVGVRYSDRAVLTVT